MRVIALNKSEHVACFIFLKCECHTCKHTSQAFALQKNGLTFFFARSKKLFYEITAKCGVIYRNLSGETITVLNWYQITCYI